MSSVLFNNFVRGKLDEDLSGRFDLPVFTNGFPVLQNFISNYKGVLKYRTGFEYIADTSPCATLVEFKFNTEQSYLLVFQGGYYKENGYTEPDNNCKIDIYTYDSNGEFGYISSINTELNVCVPIFHTQNADVMIVGLDNTKGTDKIGTLYTLKRTGASEFVLERFSFKDYEDVNWGTINKTSPSAYGAAFYKGRLWFADSVNRLRASQVGDYYNFVIPKENIKDDSPLSFTLTEISDPIKWVYGGKNNLLVGNGEGISIINGGSPGVSITSTKVNADLGNKEGSSYAIPTEKDSEMLYVGVDKKRVYSFDYDLVSEKFISSNLNLLCEDIPAIEEIYYKRDNNNLVYGRTADGQMIALLYNKAENIIGWYPIKTKGFVNSVCTVRRPDGKDDLFISVTRDGQHYIERLSDELEFDNMFDVDSLAQIDSDKTEKLKKEKFLASRYLDSWELVESEQNKGDQLTLRLKKANVVDFYDMISNQTRTISYTDTDLNVAYQYTCYDYIEFADGSSVGGEIDFAPDGSTIYPNRIFHEKYITTEDVYCIVGSFPEEYEYFDFKINGELKRIYKKDIVKKDVIPVGKVDGRNIHSVRVKANVCDASIFGDSADNILIDVTAKKNVQIRYIDGYQGLEGVVFSIFANGGYLGQAIVDKNGVIDIGREVSSCIIGYPYLGIAKTFNIGSWIDGVNFQTVKKRAVSFAIRFVNSGSFKVGTSLDNLQQIQEFSTNDEYDSAPQIMNGDRFIHGYNDDHNKEKCLFFVQDEPVPCNVTMVECNVTFNKLD